MSDADEKPLQSAAASGGRHHHAVGVVGTALGWRAVCECGWSGEVLTLEYARASGRVHLKLLRYGEVATGPAS
jgi:hypothetical protein